MVTAGLIATLRDALQRGLDGKPVANDVELLKAAFAAGHLVLASGDRSVAGGNFAGAIVITGDGNVVMRISIDNAAALNALLARVYPSRLRQLPSDLADFQGRSDGEAELLAALSGGGAVSLSAINGMGGIGKTALAVRLAHKLKDQYPDAQLFIDLKGVSEPVTAEAALERLIHSFEPQAQLPENLEDLQAIYRSQLTGRRVIVVLDNARDGEQVRPLIPPSPSIAIITSRRSIALPGLVPKTLGKLDPQSSRALLRGLVPDTKRASDQDLNALAGRCGYLPLALRAAGSFLLVNRDWTVAEYLRDLTKTRDRLKGPDDLNLDVLTVLGFSAAHLRKDNASLADRWCLLQVFPADFDRAAVAAVWKVEEDETRDELSQLLRWSMLDHDADTRRYSLHDLMRDVAIREGINNKLEEAQGQATIRHAIHYLSVLAKANSLYKQGREKIVEGLALYDSETINIAHGQAFAPTLTDTDGPLAKLPSDYADAGAHLLSLRLHPRTRIDWLEKALASSRKTSDQLCQAKHLGNLGTAYSRLGEVHKAIEHYEQALVISRGIDDLKGEGSHVGNLGTVYADLGEVRKAIVCYELGLAIARHTVDRRTEGIRLSNLGLAYVVLGEVWKAVDYVRKAVDYHKQALAIFRDIGDLQGEGSCYDNLGDAYSQLGKIPKTIKYHKKAVAIAHAIGDWYGKGNSLGSLGNAYSILGDVQKAIDCYEQGLAILEAKGSPDAKVFLNKLTAIKARRKE